MVSKDGIVLDRREMLRVKVKSLTAEAYVIRREESRCVGQRYDVLRGMLHDHRVKQVRWEARDTHLAYGFIRGRTYEQMEPTSESLPGWDNIRKMITRFGPVNPVEKADLLTKVGVVETARKAALAAPVPPSGE